MTFMEMAIIEVDHSANYGTCFQFHEENTVYIFSWKNKLIESKALILFFE